MSAVYKRVMKKFYAVAMNVALSLLLCVAIVSCDNTHGGTIDTEFEEKESITTIFPNIEVYYSGDVIGESQSDAWTVKFYTDMEYDLYGNLVGPGEIMQILLNANFEKDQRPNLKQLEGRYVAQSNSGDFSAYTFIYGYMDYIDLPDGRHERPDGTFYASFADGSTEMNADFADDGSVDIVANSDGTYTISGTLVGKQCRKRNFSWRGTIEPKSEVVEKVKNSLLTSDISLSTLTQVQMQDKGDSFYIKDESYRNILLFLAEPTISFEWGKPKGSGEVLRLELLVPWDTDINEGLPAGTYTMMVRNADTSINREDIVPYRIVPGLPDRFMVPYWAGAWYVRYADGAWGDNYARIDGGTVTVERGEDGSHRFICNLTDCSSPAYLVAVDVTISKENVIIYK